MPKGYRDREPIADDGDVCAVCGHADYRAELNTVEPTHGGGEVISFCDACAVCAVCAATTDDRIEFFVHDDGTFRCSDCEAA